MLKKMTPRCLFVAILIFAFSSQSMAASVDVAGDCYYFANGNLTVTSLTSGIEIANFGDADGVNNATEIVVNHGKAVVTTDDAGTKDVVVLDISGLTGCFDSVGDLPYDGECNEEKYMAKYKQGIGTNYLEIPGVEVNDKIYHVTMEQRGKSSNWEVAFVEEIIEVVEPVEEVIEEVVPVEE